MNLSARIKRIYKKSTKLKKEPIRGLLITDYQLKLHDNFIFSNICIANQTQK